ncbi:MAG: hypothetical protein AB7O49_16605 [Sphingomonadales bacterium]
MAAPDQSHDWIRPRTLLILALAAGLLLRLAVVPLPAIYFPDEIWQYMEPARHLAGDRWVISWEFREGMRGWLLPAVLTPPHLLGDWLAPGSQLPMMLQRTLCAMLSLGVIAGATGLGLRVSRLHGLFAALVSVVWFELVYLSPRALSEIVSLGFVLPAIYLLQLPPERRTRGMMAAAGALLGLTFCLRFHLAPALLVLAAFGCGKQLRVGWVPLIAGGAAALAVSGIADAAAGQVPFEWMIRNFTINVLERRSEQFGTEPFYWYVNNAVQMYGLMVIPGAILAISGARLQPAMFAAALVNLAVHSAIPHKEPRFMLFSAVLLVILAALGTAELLNWLARRWPAATSPPSVAAAAIFWVGVSVVLAVLPPFDRAWLRSRELVLSLGDAAREPAACGLGLIGLWSIPTGSYTLYNRDTPIYLFLGEDAAERASASASSYNMLVATPGAGVPEGYQLRRCYRSGPNAKGPLPPFCLHQRPGQCAPGAEAVQNEINAVLRRHGY